MAHSRLSFYSSENTLALGAGVGAGALSSVRTSPEMKATSAQQLFQKTMFRIVESALKGVSITRSNPSEFSYEIHPLYSTEIKRELEKFNGSIKYTIQAKGEKQKFCISLIHEEEFMTRSSLELVLDNYEKDFGSDYRRLITAIPAEYFWRFFIDDKDQDRGMLAYENEEGYLLAMTKAFQQLFQPVEDLNTFTKQLHFLATSQVKLNRPSSEYSEEKHKAGSYRLSNAFSLRPKGDLTPKGAEAMLKRIKESATPVSVSLYIFHDNVIAKIFTSDKIREETAKFFLLDLITPKTTQLLLDAIKDPRKQVVLQPATFNEKGYFSWGEKEHVNEKVERDMLALISQCQLGLARATSQFDKLKTITHFKIMSENLHPFFDGNTRTLSMLLGNYLLMQNGFPPISGINPNLVYCESLDQLVEKTIIGMNHTLRMAQGVEPFSEKTESLLECLSLEQKAYFNETVAIIHSIQEQLTPKLRRSSVI